MRVSIIIPAYNEEKRIGRTLESYSYYFESLRKEKSLDYEILVVINNTSDNTEKIVISHKKLNSRIRYLNLKRGGKGYAIIEGFKDSLKRPNDLIGFVDADLATKPDAFYSLIKNIGNSGGVIASRYMSKSVVSPKNTLPRILASRVFNSLIRALFLMPYRDTQCGAKLFSRNAIKSISNFMGMTKWAFDVELIYRVRHLGFKVREIPTVWSDRNYSTINFWQSGPFMALAIIRLRILASPLRRFIRVYDKFIGFIPK